MKKIEIDNNIFYKLDESEIKAIKNRYSSLIEDIDLEFALNSKKMSEEDILKIENSNFFTIDQTILDLLDCNVEILEPIKFDTEDDGCNILELETTVDDLNLEFNIPSNDDENCRNIVLDISNKLKSLTDIKTNLTQTLGSLENKFYHFRYVGILFERIKFYHNNISDILQPTNFDTSKTLNSKNINITLNILRNELEQQSNFIRLNVDGSLNFQFKNEIPQDGNIFLYYNELNNYTSNISEADKKEEDSTSKIISKIESFKQLYIEDIYNNFFERVDVISKEIALSDFLLSGGNISVYLSSISNINSYNDLLREWLNVKQEYNDLINEIESINSEIDNCLIELNSIPCKQISKQNTSNIDSGSKLNDYEWNIPDLNVPSITDLLYWVRYCGIASIINLIPSYYPIGILVPNPSGITKIPMPIIWIPLAVFNSPIGIFVIVIGQCGTVPSPCIFHWNPSTTNALINSNESKFIVGLRDSKTISNNTGNNILMSNVKHVDQDGNIKFPLDNPTVTSLTSIITKNLTNSDALKSVFPLGDLIPTQDDFPVWERLSVDNIHYINYLVKWCQSGKEICGFSTQ